MKSKQEVWERTLDEYLNVLGYDPSEAYKVFSSLEKCLDLADVTLHLRNANAHTGANLELRANYQGALSMPMGPGNNSDVEQLFTDLSGKTGIQFRGFSSDCSKKRNYQAEIRLSQNTIHLELRDGRTK